MSRFEYFLSVDDIYQALTDTVSVRESLMGRSALLHRLASQLGVDIPAAIKSISTARQNTNPTWSDADRRCDTLEFAFSENWRMSGFPTYTLTDSMAALLSMTRSPPLDFQHSPHPAFVIEVPKRYIPLESRRPTVTIVVESYGAMGLRENAGNIGVTPDTSSTSRWAQTGGAANIDEDISKKDWMRVAIRIASNVIAYINEHRPGSPSVPRVNKDDREPVFEVRPPRDIVVDRAFRDAASALVHAGNLNAARGVLSHYVRGHWRNQAVGAGLQDRRLTWIRPHKRGDVSFGRVVERVEQIGAH